MKPEIKAPLLRARAHRGREVRAASRARPAAHKTEDSTQPSLIAAVVRFGNILKVSGETQIIMTVPQE